MQIGIGISLTGGGRPGFYLSNLFASASGFDFTDLDVTKTWGADGVKLLKKDALNTPVAASADAVQAMLDKSTNFALGAELLANGDFSGGATGWTLDAGWAVAGGVAQHTAGSAGDVVSTTSTTSASGDTYRTSTTVAGRTAGQAWTKGPFQNSAIAPSANGVFADLGVTTVANASIRWAGNSAFDGNIDNLSCKKVTAFSANQGTSASRPTWQANSGKPYLNFDGVDDNLLSTLNPAASMTLAICGRGATTSTVLMGSSGGATSRSFISLNASGQFSGGWGSDPFSTICGGAAVTGSDFVGLMRANGTTVELWLGVSGSASRIYQAAANGVGNTTVPYMLGALNSSGSPFNFHNGRIYSAVAVQSYIADSDVLPLMRLLGATAGLSF